MAASPAQRIDQRWSLRLSRCWLFVDRGSLGVCSSTAPRAPSASPDEFTGHLLCAGHCVRCQRSRTKETWHLPLELPVKTRDWQVKGEVTGLLRGQVGHRRKSNVGLRGSRCYSAPGSLAPKPTLSPPPLKPLQRHQGGGKEGDKATWLVLEPRVLDLPGAPVPRRSRSQGC